MPIIALNAKKISPKQQSLLEKINNGKIVPLISGEVINDLYLGGQKKMVEGYADYIEYPLDDRDNLLQMAKYSSVLKEMDNWQLKSDYLNFIKNHLYGLAQQEGLDEEKLEEAAEQVDNVTASEFAKLLGYPKFGNKTADPLLILADLPLPIYLTTSPYNFIEQALTKAGKTSHTEICRWHTGLDSLPSIFDDKTYIPTVAEPLVYHLHGLDNQSDSLVLTEDDYLQFLVMIAEGRGKNIDRIPVRVRQAMSDSALMLLGYPLPSWSFRVLFWGLIKSASMSHKGIFALQLEASEEKKHYLEQYLKREADFEVYWQDIRTYIQELKGK